MLRFFDVQLRRRVAFWGNEQTLDYDADIVWSMDKMQLVSQSSPEFAIDVGSLVLPQIRSSA